MTLSELLEGLPLTAPPPRGWEALEASGLEYDSRRAAAGTLFFAFSGAHADGRKFAGAAMEQGAVAVVSELPPLEDFRGPWLQVEHGREALAIAARRFYSMPDERLTLTGVTGTNGKTTTVFALDAALRALGRVTGMAGTIEYRVAGEVLDAINTTPESLDLIRLMRRTLDAGGSHFQFEVSSHSLELRRVHGLSFHTAVFTNLTRDHLDFHRSMESYFAAKARLFSGAGGPPPPFAVVNADDEWSGKLEIPPSTRRLTYGIRSPADLKVDTFDAGFAGLRFNVRHPKGRTEVDSPMCGIINVYNLLACFGAALEPWVRARGNRHGLRRAATACPAASSASTRASRFSWWSTTLTPTTRCATSFTVARALEPKRVITLFGCGGDRDRTKRPLMGQAAAELSDFVVVTSDNPRQRRSARHHQRRAGGRAAHRRAPRRGAGPREGDPARHRRSRSGRHRATGRQGPRALPADRRHDDTFRRPRRRAKSCAPMATAPKINRGGRRTGREPLSCHLCGLARPACSRGSTVDIRFDGHAHTLARGSVCRPARGKPRRP